MDKVTEFCKSDFRRSNCNNDNFCKDDTSMLWATWSGATVPGSIHLDIGGFIWQQPDFYWTRFWSIRSRSSQEIDLIEIFDRWGGLMFRDEHFSANDPAHAWGGKRNNQLLNQGVFVYKIIYRKPDGTVAERVGNVTLVR